MFKQAFQPAVNKVGLSKLTFVQHEMYETEIDKVDKVTGEVTQVPYSAYRITFNVMGKYIGTNQEIRISCPPAISEDNKLGTLLTNLGFKFPELATVTDDDGFEVADEGVEFDDDGFGQCESDLDELTVEITTFLDSLIGKEFVAKVKKNAKGYWEIDHTTVKPFSKKTSAK